MKRSSEKVSQVEPSSALTSETVKESGARKLKTTPGAPADTPPNPARTTVFMTADAVTAPSDNSRRVSLTLSGVRKPQGLTNSLAAAAVALGRPLGLAETAEAVLAWMETEDRQ